MVEPTAFISYSHKDQIWLDRLVTHLGVSAEEGLLQIWDDRRIQAGTEWLSEIQGAIDAAAVAILLVSADFLTSKFIRGEEVPRILERRSQNGLQVFPVIVRSCDWQIVDWLTRLQIRPWGAQPLASFKGDRRDAELASLAREIRQLLAKPPLRIEPEPTPAETSPSAIAFRPLHQLPSPPTDFTGREVELAELKEAVVQGGALISGLQGMGGIGKTTLALKLADELTPLFPDAQIYLDLKGASREPLTAAQAMAHVVRSYQPALKLIENEGELAGLYRSVLHGQHALLVMDNAASREQVEPLIPPQGCALIVTSRLRFTLPGLLPRDLGQLPHNKACELLLRIAPRVGHKATEIASLCGGLPLALRLAGGAIAERLDISPEDYARRLADNQERLDLAKAALALSYDLLSAEFQSRWRVLAVFPGTFNVRAAADLWGSGEELALSVLGDFIRCNLLEWMDGRYRLHDLARVLADSLLNEKNREIVQRRHAEHYLEVFREANALYDKGGSDFLAGLHLFDTEWGNIKAGQKWAAEHARQDKMAARICSNYLIGTLYCLAMRQPPREQLEWLEAALASAQRLKDHAAKKTHLGNLGTAYMRLGEYRRAIDLYQAQLPFARGIGDRHSEGVILSNLGYAFLSLGESRRAVKLFEQALTVVSRSMDRYVKGLATFGLGEAYMRLGEIRRALRFYEQALANSRESGERRKESTVLGSIAAAYLELGDLSSAVESCEKALIIQRENKDRGNEGRSLAILSRVYAVQGDVERTLDLLDQASTLLQELDTLASEGAMFHLMAKIYADLGKLSQATELYERGLVIFRTTGDRYEESSMSWDLGEIYEKEGNLVRAANLMQVCVDYYRKVGHADAETRASVLEGLRTRLTA